jgi:competence protein ComEC
MVNKINLYVSQPASSLASGMLFGDSSFSEEMKQIFRVAGLSHIIVLSGFNIAIIISFVLFLMSFLPFFIRVISASIGVIFFVIMVGAEASVVRATLMAFIALLATSLGRQYVAKQALILSLLAIVLYEPGSLLHNVSLHLSFIATAGIIYLSEPIHFFISRYVEKKFLQEIFTSTLSAYGMTLPYLMYIFGSVSLYAIVANVAVLFFVPIGMLLTFVVVVVSYLSSFGALLFGLLTTVLMDYIIMCAKVVSSLPYASISINVSLSMMIILYLFLCFVFVFTKWKEKDETLRTEKDVLLSGVIRY